ncbi:MAG: M15 family metallopeptidase, partial [Paludibacteraceae bacterium]|nr:M15 family metallopeptidase [Paludibacteraceae bacterium]
AVGANLVIVNFCGQKVQFTKVNGAAKALQAVSDELQKLPNYAGLKKFLGNGGTFVFRPVRGTNRLSAHSFGIAIDIGYDRANKKNLSTYWKWDNGKAGELTKIGYKNSIPMDIVRVFEKHGFIWGGRWYHYDTMHFEYRPEYFKK